MSLPRIFKELYAEALQSGRPAFKRLQQGATIKVKAAGRRRQVILGRRLAPVSEVEETTFRRDGQIPDDAARVAYDATPDGWYYTAYTWEEPAGLFDEEEAEDARNS